MTPQRPRIWTPGDNGSEPPPSPSATTDSLGRSLAIATGVGFTPSAWIPTDDTEDAFPCLGITFQGLPGVEPPPSVTLVMPDEQGYWLGLADMLDKAANRAREMARDANRKRRNGVDTAPG